MSHPKRYSVLVFFCLCALGLILFGRDALHPDDLFFKGLRDPNPWLLSYPWRAQVRRSFSEGQFPLWNPYNGLGEAFIANYQPAAFSVLRWPFYFLNFKFVVVPFILFELVFAGFGAWLLARRMKLSGPSSFLCGAGFMLSGYLVQYLNNQHLVMDLLIPYGLLAGARFVEKSSWKNFGLMILVFVLVLVGGQPGAALFTLTFMFLFLIFQAQGKDAPGKILPASLAFMPALMIALIQLLPFVEAIPQSWTYHPPGYASQHLQIKTLASIISPGMPLGIFQYPIQQTFPWLGETVTLLALVSIFCIWRLRREAIFFALIGILGLGAIYGLPGFALVSHVPGLSRLSLFKYPQPVITFCFVMLAGFGFEKIFVQKAKLAPAILGPVAFLAVLGSGIYNSVYFLAEKTGRTFEYGSDIDPVLRMHSAQAALVALILMVIALWSARSRRLLGWIMIGCAIAAPVAWHRIFDNPPLWMDMQKVEPANFSKLARENNLARFAAEPLVWMPDQMLPLPLFDLGVNNALIAKRYVRLVSRLNRYSNEDELMNDFFAFHSLRLREYAFSENASRILAAKYFIRKEASADQSGFWMQGKHGMERKFTHTALFGDPIFVVPIKNSLPRVFFPLKVSAVNAEGGLDAILKLNDPEDEALVEGLEKPELASILSRPQTSSLQVDLDKVVLGYDSPGPAFAVFSEQYFPGWRSFLDGKEVKIYQADYLLRGVFLSAGKHQLRMEYQPVGFRIGLWSALSSLAVLIACSGFLPARSKRERSPGTS